ncbi:MAG: SPFH domain-containing protein [Eubacteriales bacterium]
MGIFSQLPDIVEWSNVQEGAIFWKWPAQEIKKGSKLVIRPGQDAIFLSLGAIEGVFEDDGTYDIESEIIPFLSSLAGFQFGFKTPLRAEVVFINTKELLVRWGTKNAINLQAPGLPGGMPIRAFGTFSCRCNNHINLIDTMAGIGNIFTVEDVKERIISNLNQLLMSWIGKVGRDMFNLQMDAQMISDGILNDLNKQLEGIGILITDFTIESFSYPEEIRKMQEKAASQAMVGDVNKYQQLAMADSFGKGGGSNMAADMVSMQMGMAMGQQMAQQMNPMYQNNNMGVMHNTQGSPVGVVQQVNQQSEQQAENGNVPNFCPNCGSKTGGAKFCGNCGTKLA